VPSEPLNLAALWGKFIKEEGRNNTINAFLTNKDPAIQEAVRRIRDFMSGIDGRFLAALAQEKAERDRISFLAYAEEEGLKKGFNKGFEQGQQEGRMQGLKEGREEGLQQGIQQGLQQGEKQAQLEIARRMKAQNFSVEQIQTLTGLQYEDIINL